MGCNHNRTTDSSGFKKLGLDTASQTYTVTPEDPEMNSAITKAKRTIAEFDEALNRNDTFLTDFAIKKRYPTADNGGEHIWVAILNIENGNYRGIVNNDAEKTTQVKYGDTVIVKKSEITDWMYLDKNLLKGGFTIREIRNHLDKTEKAKMDSSLGFKIQD